MAENNNVPAVFAKSLKKVFVDKKNPALDSIALNGIDLTVPKGGLVALVGPDGAGKTTFMRLVCGLLTPTSGELEVFGMNTVTDSEAIQERIAYMPQRFGLYQDLSIKENMDLFANLQGVPEDERKEKYACTIYRPVGRTALRRYETKARTGLRPDSRPGFIDFG